MDDYGKLLQIRELANAHTLDSITALAEIMNDPNEDVLARVEAADAILNIGWGKPEQPVEITIR